MVQQARPVRRARDLAEAGEAPATEAPHGCVFLHANGSGPVGPDLSQAARDGAAKVSE